MTFLCLDSAVNEKRDIINGSFLWKVFQGPIWAINLESRGCNDLLVLPFNEIPILKWKQFPYQLTQSIKLWPLCRRTLCDNDDDDEIFHSIYCIITIKTKAFLRVNQTIMSYFCPAPIHTQTDNVSNFIVISLMHPKIVRNIFFNPI